MIENLELKLEGKIPVTREELFELVSTWGRITRFNTIDGIMIEKCEPKEKYNLSNLDVSQIEDLSYIFRESYYNGDVSNWNVSNVKNMSYLFYYSNFNGDVSNWNVSNVNNMIYMFSNSNFNQDISKWKFNKDVNCFDIFYNNENFVNKYNNGNNISSYTHDFLIWFKENREKIKNLNTTKEDILDFFSFDSNDLKLS